MLFINFEHMENLILQVFLALKIINALICNSMNLRPHSCFIYGLRIRHYKILINTFSRMIVEIMLHCRSHWKFENIYQVHWNYNPLKISWKMKLICDTVDWRKKMNLWLSHLILSFKNNKISIVTISHNNFVQYY